MKRMFLTSIPVVAFLLLVGLFAFVPLSAASDFFLHSTTNDFLDNISPTDTTAKFKDSTAVNRTTYQEIGTWTAAPAATAMRLSSLTDLHVWIGLKNSDDQGTYFDLRAELRKNGVVIASGETKTIQGVTRNPANAKEVAVAFGPITGDQFNPGDVLSIKILTKVADSGGHNNAVGLRLYYDAVSRPSSFGAVFVVDTTPPTIAAVINPAPNAAGWHKSDATVSFTCSDSESGVASCPAPITVSTEGANQVIAGTATDLAGNSGTASLTVNLDKSAPTVTITSPSNGATVTSSPVNVTGTATDTLSGIATVLCNGNPASLSASTFSCDVPLTSGPNTITVQATDIAGNTGSSSIAVTLGQPLEPQSPPVVFGPQRFTQPNEAVSFFVANPVGPFWLQVENGQDGQNLVSSGSIFLNGVQVAGPQDFIQDSFGFQKDVTLQNVNTLEVELSGTAGSFITIEIREAEPNVAVSNLATDLSGHNVGDSIELWWADDERATDYVVFRASSIQGPWQELFRRPVDRPNGVDFTPDARLMDLCYKVESFDTFGQVVRTYEPICVRKFVETQTQSFVPERYSPNIRSASLSSSSTQGMKQPLQQSVSVGFPTNLATVATMAVNNHQVSDSVVAEPSTPAICVGPEDNYSNGRGFVREISKEAQGILERTLRGRFLTFQTWEAEPNVAVSNLATDLSGHNVGDSIELWWADDERATDYVVFRASSIQGPWQELFRRPVDRPNGVDFTPDARLVDLCYKLEARDAAGLAIRIYQPICLPKFVEPKRRSLNLEKSLAILDGLGTSKTRPGPRYSLQLASLNLMADAPDPRINKLCFADPDPEFRDWKSMGLDKSKIQEFLKSKGSFLQRRIRDVDPGRTEFDPAQAIFDAAQLNQINPQVILTILQREQGAITAKTPIIDDRRLRRIMGWDRRDQFVALENKSIREQIADGTAQLRRDFDRLTKGDSTIGGWRVEFEKTTTDGVLVTPANKPAAVMYSYNPEVGERWGGGRDVGGNSSFCNWWEQFGFKREPVAISPQNPTLVCGPDASVTLTASGGRPGPDGYSWSVTGNNLTTTEGVLTVTGVNKQNVQIKPPDNRANQVPVSVAAYLYCSLGALTLNSNNCVPLGFSSPVTIGQHFGCADNYLACTHVELLCSDPNLPAFNNRCVNCSAGGLPPTFGQFQVTRSPQMIIDGCRPCRLEMQGATVTVTDAAGASSTTTMTAQ